MKIPKIIHQIWSGIDEPLPTHFETLGETWKENHPEWKYILWDNKKMNTFIQQFYPQYWDIYNGFKYNIQRWDAIRYLILDKIGGMYVDFDYECLEPLDGLLNNITCCFSAEPPEHKSIFMDDNYFNNALMACIPSHWFMQKIIEHAFDRINIEKEYSNKMREVLETTGPIMLTKLYAECENKEDIYIIPPELVSPFTKGDSTNYLLNQGDKIFESYLEKKIEKALAIHYFLGNWLK
jgi:mannosyltransferase OCH1-like enzyme